MENLYKVASPLELNDEFLTAKVAVQQSLMKYVCLSVCLSVCLFVCVTFEIHLLKVHQANQSTV